ncbi:hypothetical protein BGW38_006278 [Lunasporangiospora selenospora]|uniref:DNA endonuclease activator Ctp1 C-terminal domain-containing protein n=1 Tax=Lunasporangiospora selenospora TaxID=979761 RepID=A0A9P6KIV6_9FUNG|nr:hypothetical protein BGW38_006278 [Lunasporangiospora selenospora]
MASNPVISAAAGFLRLGVEDMLSLTTQKIKRLVGRERELETQLQESKDLITKHQLNAIEWCTIAKGCQRDWSMIAYQLTQIQHKVSDALRAQDQETRPNIRPSTSASTTDRSSPDRARSSPSTTTNVHVASMGEISPPAANKGSARVTEDNSADLLRTVADTISRIMSQIAKDKPSREPVAPLLNRNVNATKNNPVVIDDPGTSTPLTTASASNSNDLTGTRDFSPRSSALLSASLSSSTSKSSANTLPAVNANSTTEICNCGCQEVIKSLKAQCAYTEEMHSFVEIRYQKLVVGLEAYKAKVERWKEQMAKHQHQKRMKAAAVAAARAADSNSLSTVSMSMPSTLDTLSQPSLSLQRSIAQSVQRRLQDSTQTNDGVSRRARFSSTESGENDSSPRQEVTRRNTLYNQLGSGLQLIDDSITSSAVPLSSALSLPLLPSSSSGNSSRTTTLANNAGIGAGSASEPHILIDDLDEDNDSENETEQPRAAFKAIQVVLDSTRSEEAFVLDTEEDESTGEKPVQGVEAMETADTEQDMVEQTQSPPKSPTFPSDLALNRRLFLPLSDEDEDDNDGDTGEMFQQDLQSRSRRDPLTREDEVQPLPQQPGAFDMELDSPSSIQHQASAQTFNQSDKAGSSISALLRQPRLPSGREHSARADTIKNTLSAASTVSVSAPVSPTLPRRRTSTANTVAAAINSAGRSHQHDTEMERYRRTMQRHRSSSPMFDSDEETSHLHGSNLTRPTTTVPAALERREGQQGQELQPREIQYKSRRDLVQDSTAISAIDTFSGPGDGKMFSASSTRRETQKNLTSQTSGQEYQKATVLGNVGDRNGRIEVSHRASIPSSVGGSSGSSSSREQRPQPPYTRVQWADNNDMPQEPPHGPSLDEEWRQGYEADQMSENRIYNYTERRKDKRKQMHGQDCECCRRFYEVTGPLPPPDGHHEFFTPAPRPGEREIWEQSADKQLEHRINETSRHRVQYETPLTPPGFWDVDFPPTPERKRWDQVANERRKFKRQKQRTHHLNSIPNVPEAGARARNRFFPNCDMAASSRRPALGSTKEDSMDKLFSSSGKGNTPSTTNSTTSHHRSVTVQKIATLRGQLANAPLNATNNNRSLVLAQLWSLAVSPIPYTSSVATTAITDLVATGALDWTETLQGFENALGSTGSKVARQGSRQGQGQGQGQSQANMIQALSSLFIAAAEFLSSNSTTTAKTSTGAGRHPSQGSISRSAFASKNNRHPFVALISTHPGVEISLFGAMDRIISYSSSKSASLSGYQIQAFDLVAPFLDFCLLDRHQRTTIVSSTAMLWILKVLNGLLASNLGSTQDGSSLFTIRLFDYLCSIPARFPLDRESTSTALQAGMQSLVDYYRLPSTQLSLDSNYKSLLGGRILFLLVSWIADMRRLGLSTVFWMQMAETLVTPKKDYTVPALSFDRLWPLLSYLLMNASTVDEQRILVDWMHSALIKVLSETDEAAGTLDAMIANLAFLPIFQVMGESQMESVSKKCSEMLQRLETIPKTKHSHAVQQKEVSTKDKLLRCSGVAGMIHAEVNHLRRIWTDESLATGSLSSDDGDSEEKGPLFSFADDRVLSSLVLTTMMFHPDEQYRIRALTEQSQAEDGQLVTLVLFLYVLRVDASPMVKLHLLQESIPALVTDRDEVVTARVLKIILTLINGSPHTNTSRGSKSSTFMGAVGVRILFMIWKRQPRVWKTLRHVIHEWVEMRPRLLKTPVRGEPEYDMEVAVLTTIRDVCAFDAAGYADILIPFLSSLLHSVELYASSICIIIETINIAVDAGIVEPRAAWNVLLCHIAEHAVTTEHSRMLQEMCVFYGIVGSSTEDTQVFLDLKEVISNEYIKPLLDSKDPEVLASALRALACFTAPEILTTLAVEVPGVYIRERILEATDSQVVDEYSLVLEKLVRHELTHMRRGLFKDSASSRRGADGDQQQPGTQELDRMLGVMSVVSSSVLQKWQSGDVNPGLRIGYALSSQLCSSVLDRLPSSSSLSQSNTGAGEGSGDGNKEETTAVIRTQQGYRNLMTALTDVTLTDHLVERTCALEGWTAMFDNMWMENDDIRTLAIAETLIGDLYKKIADGFVPAHCANALFAISGIVLSLHRHSHPASTVQSSVLAKYLLQNFVQTDGVSDVGGSDEVQFAVLVSLSFITPLAAVDEKLVRAVINVFLERLEEDALNPSTSSELSNWATFATGWAFCNLLSGLVDYPTKTSELNQICQQTLQQLVAVFDREHGSFALTLGLLMAFPRLSIAVTASTTSRKRNVTSASEGETQAVQKIISMARTDLRSFLDNQQQVLTPQRLARLLGAPWVVAFSDRSESSQDERKDDTELLDGALLLATSRRDLQPQLVHFTVPFCHTIHMNLDARNPPSNEISLFTGRIHSLVNLIRITPTSAARHTAVIALGSCFGIDWSRGPTVASVGASGLFSFLAANSTLSSVTNSALTTLIELSGLSIQITGSGNVGPSASTLNSGSATNEYAIVIPAPKAANPKSMLMVQDLKAGRLSAMVLGHIACHVHRLRQTDKGRVIGTSTEPKDYSRLSASTSWLRAIFDGLWEPLQMGAIQKAQKTYRVGEELLLYTIQSLPTPLPAVNWFTLLTQLIAEEPQVLSVAIQVASKHANTSTSLMEFLVMILSNMKPGTGETDDTVEGKESSISPEELIVGEEGLGRVLTLGGLPRCSGGDQAAEELDKVRGLEGLAKKVSLPTSRVVDLVESLAKQLFSNTTTSQEGTKSESGQKHASGENLIGSTPIEVLQLIFLDTLCSHMRQHGRGTTANINSSGQGKQQASILTSNLQSPSSILDSAKELLQELRTVMLRVFTTISVGRISLSSRVLKRLADLSMMSLSHLESALLDTVSRPEAEWVLKRAVAVASLYRAGYLPSHQEVQLTQICQSALSILATSVTETNDLRDIELAESAISVLLYAMYKGPQSKNNPYSHEPLTEYQQKKLQSIRLSWLQRILDLLVLVSSLQEIFVKALQVLLGGATLLWWGEQHPLEQEPFDLDGEVGGTNPGVSRTAASDDAEARFLAMADDHVQQLEIEVHRKGQMMSGQDYNLLEDDSFDKWHLRFMHSVSSLTTAGPPVSAAHDGHDTLREDVIERMTLTLPGVVVGGSSGRALNSKDGNQMTNRLLKLAMDPKIGLQERDLLVTLLRRVEDFVPKEFGWVLL